MVDKDKGYEACWAHMNGSPVVKMLWMVLYLAVKDKTKKIVFSYNRGSREGLLIKDGSFDEVRLPRHMFKLILKKLRVFAGYVRRDSGSAFTCTYTETKEERRFELEVNYDEPHVPADECDEIMTWLAGAEHERDHLRWRKSDQEARKRKWKAAGISAASILVTLLISYFVS